MVLTCNASSYAQQKPQLRVISEKLDSDGEKCNLSNANLDSISKLTLRSNGVDVAEQRSLTNVLYVNLNVIYAQQGACIYSLSVEINGLANEDFTMQKLNGFASKKRQTILCSKQGVGTVSQGRANTAILQTLETYIKLCLGELIY